MGLSPYRPQDGWLVRRLFFVLMAAYGAFTAFRVYIWAKVWKMGLPVVLNHSLNWGEIGGIVVLIAFFIGSYYLLFINIKTSDFMIEVEAELRKVSWPEYKPIGSPKAELWGSTYIVIGVVAVLAAYIYLVDTVYNLIAMQLFYR